MGYVFMIVAGAVEGWLAAFVLRADRTSRGLRLNIVAGVTGALLAGLVVAPMIGAGDLAGSNYSVSALIFSMLGAVALPAALNLLHLRDLR